MSAMVRELSADPRAGLSQRRLVHHHDRLDGPAAAQPAYDGRNDVGQCHHTAGHMPAVDGRRFRLYQRRNCFSSMVRRDGQLDGTTRFQLGQLDDEREHDGPLTQRPTWKPPSFAHYPPSVTSVLAVEPEAKLRREALENAA